MGEREGVSRYSLRFEILILLLHLLLALAVRAVAWPEVTTPAYLWSRGMVLYRDVKFLHTPGLIGLLALAFRVFGPQTFVVRAFAIAGPLVGQALVLRQTRRLSPWRRALVSAFYAVCLFVADGNAVWPVVLMAALSLPIASELTRGRWLRAGLWIGAAILMKQTAARRTFRAVVPLVAGAALPYAAALGVFALFGAAGEMIQWTVLVPFQVQEVTFTASAFTLGVIALCFLPTIAAAALEKTHRDPSAAWLLAVAFGFTLLCYPNFLLLQTVAALPCLAVGAARLLEILPSRVSRWVAVGLFVFTVSRATILVVGTPLNGRVLFWNEDPDFNALIERLRSFPQDARVHSELWDNVLPRADRLPPGRVWVHPWLHWYFGIENVRERVLQAAREPGTIWVGYRTSLSGEGGERVGPFTIRQIGSPPGQMRETPRTPPRGEREKLR